MNFEEFKQRFQARRREAQREYDRLSRGSEGILKEYKFLIELGELSIPDIKAGRLDKFLQKLKDHGLNGISEFEGRVPRLRRRLERICGKLEELKDELSRTTARCSNCGGIGYEKGIEWVEGETERIPIPKSSICPLCSGRGKFDVNQLLE